MARSGSLTLSSDEWLAKDTVYGQEAAGQDGADSPRIQCRVSPQILRLMQELRENPASPFYGRYGTLSDMVRDMVYQSAMIMGEAWKGTKEEAIGIRLKEQVVARAGREMSEATRIAAVVDPAVKSIQDDWERGAIDSAVKFLDDFLVKLIDLEDEKIIGGYVRMLLSHPAFKKVRMNSIVREKSNLLVPMEDKYEPKIAEVVKGGM